MGAPVEMEFAVTMSRQPNQPRDFALLQLRPLGLSKDSDPLDMEDVPGDRLICRSTQVLGMESQAISTILWSWMWTGSTGPKAKKRHMKS